MTIFDIALGALAIVALVTTAVLDPVRLRAAMVIAARNLAFIGPALILMTGAAAMLSLIIPNEVIASWIGPSSGVMGVVIASFVGAAIPGGPMISFPLLVALQTSGAGTAQLIALLSGWSAVALHRMFMFEIPLMGPLFAYRRVLASLPIPILTGLIALLLTS